MAKKNTAQLALPVATFAASWAAYEAAMTEAAQTADALALALLNYLRAGGPASDSWRAMRAFDAACMAARSYTYAIAGAEPYHFGAIPAFDNVHVINLGARELRAFVRDLQGDTVQHVRRDPVDSRRATVEQIQADNGIAGFFRLELRSMRPFGSPRRDPGAIAA